MAVISHVKWDYPIKKALYPLSLLLGVPKMKITYTKSRPETIFQLLTFTFDPFFNVKWGYLTTKALCLFSSSLFLILRWEIINFCGSGLVTFRNYGASRSHFSVESDVKLPWIVDVEHSKIIIFEN